MDKLLMRPTAIVWLVLNCSSLVILVVLYNVARDELNFNKTVFKDPAYFYGAVGLVLAMAPVHYALLHYQVEYPNRPNSSRPRLVRALE